MRQGTLPWRGVRRSGMARGGGVMKQAVKIKPFWYSDIWLFPKLITIVTTLDEQGQVNAAPYSHIMQYDVMQKNPRRVDCNNLAFVR